MSEEAMRKHYEKTPKETLIKNLVASRKEVEKLQNRNKERKQEIERLNKKIEQYENPEDMTLMFMWCDEKAKDEIKRLTNIINKAIEYIKNTYIGSILEVHSGYEEEYTKPLLDILKGEDKE